MPLLKITTSTDPAPENDKLLANLSRLVAERLGKPESYVMTAIEHPARMTFAGSTEPTCYVELKNIGRFTSDQTQRLSAELCERLSAGLGVPKERIYIEFADVEAYLWGHDGDTFG
jgi:phenylpyruvate tautomerase PptA (4-oxalocrotonate tautomerase family)